MNTLKQTLKNYGFLPMILFIALFISTGCTPDDDPPGGGEGDSEQIHPAGSCDWDNLKLEAPVALLAGDETPLINKVLERAVNLVDVEQADLILVSTSQLEAKASTIKAAYDRGATIALFLPDKSQITSWFEANGINYIAQPNEQLLVYVFNNNGFTHTMDFVAPDTDSSFFNNTANSFIYWSNKATQPGSRSESVDLKDYASSQSISHTYYIKLEDKHLADVALSDPDVLTKESHVDVSYNIYPLHAFSTTSSPGDYYLVEALIVAHNGEMYEGVYTSKHGGVTAHLCGFYLSKLNFESYFIDKDGNIPSGITYPSNASPHPSTTVGSTSYQKGFEWSLGGNISGGVENGALVATAEVGFSVGWNNSESKTLSDTSIALFSSNNKVAYEYTINNLPSQGGPVKGSPEPPAISRSDMDMYSSWVWYVPSAEDYGTDKFKLQFSMNAEYKGYHWYSTNSDFAEKGPWSAIEEGNRTITRDLLPPSRVPTGCLTMTNTSTSRQYVDDIKIWKAGNTSETPDFTIDQTIVSSVGTSQSSSTEASIILPVGEYRVECVMYNKVDGGDRTDLVTLTSDGSISVKIGETLIIETSSKFIKK